MAWVDPPDWSPGQVPTAAQFDQYITENTAYLYAVSQGLTFSGCQVSRVANQSIADDNDENISFDTENFDIGSWWSSGAIVDVPAGAVPAPFTSIAVLVICLARFVVDSTGKRRIELLKNGASYERLKLVSLDDDATTMSFSAITTVVAGDNLKMNVWQNSGGALDVDLARLTVVRLAPVS